MPAMQECFVRASLFQKQVSQITVRFGQLGIVGQRGAKAVLGSDQVMPPSVELATTMPFSLTESSKTRAI